MAAYQFLLRPSGAVPEMARMGDEGKAAGYSPGRRLCCVWVARRYK